MTGLLLDVPPHEVRDRTHAALLGLGATVSAQIDELFRLKVRGTPGHECGCVLWVYLHDHCGLPVSRVFAGFYHHVEGSAPVLIEGHVEFDTLPTESGQFLPDPLPLPAASGEVARMFDTGGLLELVADGVPV